MPRPVSEKTHVIHRKWARFDRACWQTKPFVPTGEFAKIREKKQKKPKKLKISNFPKVRLPMKRKLKMVKKTAKVNEQKVRLNKVRKNAKKPNLRDGKSYRIWRESILHKFNHTCSFCGSKERLELDHIEPVSKRPDLVMADENARILCNPFNLNTDSYPKSLRAHFLGLD